MLQIYFSPVVPDQRLQYLMQILVWAAAKFTRATAKFTGATVRFTGANARFTVATTI